MKLLSALCFVLIPLSIGLGQSTPQVNGPVRDEATALKIAEARLVSVYGKKQIDSERPLHAELKGDVWTVLGTLNCPGGEGGMTIVCVGGVASAEVSAINGEILSVRHGK
jgi:hypothetical protein